VPRTIPDRVKLLFGPYHPPPLKKGDLAACLYRDADVIVTAWSDAPLSWPRGYAPSATQGGGPGLIVEDELARALRSESAAAVSYWWGIGKTTVAKWRKALGVTKTNNEGTHRLVRAATEKALAVALETELSEDERERRREVMRSMRLWEVAPAVTFGKPWTPEDDAVLGTLRDAEAAERTGHTLDGVRDRRRELGIPGFRAHEPSGASYERRTGKWAARISVRGNRYHLGTFATREEAERAYQQARRRYARRRAKRRK